MSDNAQAILLLADISGYTKFMRRHAIATSHAKQIIVRLLKSIMHASKPPLKIAELEGDAVFFYAVLPQNEQKMTATQVKNQVLDFFATFKAEVKTLSNMKACDCDACSTVDNLKLKIVIHIGEVAFEWIDQFEKLFGLDVILVHRMLKNSVPSHEYVMMTMPSYRAFEDFHGLEPEHFKETFQDIGDVETLVFYPSPYMEALQERVQKTEPPGWFERLRWSVLMRLRTMLETKGLRKSDHVFRNLQEGN